MARAIMLQGTGSDVGKSVLVAGLARALARRGYRVRPFKPQNMSNNAAVTAEGGEIGRAQALQARACGVAPTALMNPVLLKPEGERGAQLVLLGRVAGRLEAGEYQRRKGELLPLVLDSFHRLGEEADIVLVEGAGSAAEVNLRDGDVANMGFAVAAGVPVVLVGDIDRGGVIASLVGTHALLSPAERALVRGFLVNKFRGDPALFAGGLAEVARRTGWAALGLVPWLDEASRLPAEDSVTLARPRAPGPGRLKVAVPVLARIANFDDLDPLAREPDVAVEMVPPGRPLPGDADLVILPGSKATIADLAFLRTQGWDVDLAAHRRRGGTILGLCAGYQMLGRAVADPHGVEGPAGGVPGLAMLAVETRLGRRKQLRPAIGVAAPGTRAAGAAIRGYEMHMGETRGPDRARPFLVLRHDYWGVEDGAVSPDGRVAGCYVHGLFASDAFRRAFLAALGARPDAGLDYEADLDAALDGVADALERCVDVSGLVAAAAPLQGAARAAG